MVSNLHLSEMVAWLTIPAMTALGCMTAYIFCEQKQVKGSRDFLEGFFPGHTPVFYLRCDFALSVIVGTIIGVALYSPNTVYQAVAAGRGWKAAFNIVSSQRRGHDSKAEASVHAPLAAGRDDP